MNNNADKKIVTREGYEAFKKELEHLKGVGRLEAAEAIKTASEQGDLSENAEFDAAKEAQAFLEKRILELEYILKNCEIVEIQDDDIVAIGKTVTLLQLSTNKIFNIKLVGNNEANPFEMKVSVASPTGKAIDGKLIGEIVTVSSPSGNIDYKIEDVQLS